MAKYLAGIVLALCAGSTAMGQGPCITTWGVSFDHDGCDIVEHDVANNGYDVILYHIDLEIDYSIPDGEKGTVKLYLEVNDAMQGSVWEGIATWGEYNGEIQLATVTPEYDFWPNQEYSWDRQIGGVSNFYDRPVFSSGQYSFKVEIEDEFGTVQASDTHTLADNSNALDTWDIYWSWRMETTRDTVLEIDTIQYSHWEVAVPQDETGVVVTEVKEKGSSTWVQIGYPFIVMGSTEIVLSGFGAGGAGDPLDYTVAGYDMRASLYDAEDWDWDNDEPDGSATAKDTYTKSITP